jgi:hypothetical protein
MKTFAEWSSEKELKESGTYGSVPNVSFQKAILDRMERLQMHVNNMHDPKSKGMGELYLAILSDDVLKIEFTSKINQTKKDMEAEGNYFNGVGTPEQQDELIDRIVKESGIADRVFNAKPKPQRVANPISAAELLRRRGWGPR